jgi:hypothetical protein
MSGSDHRSWDLQTEEGNIMPRIATSILSRGAVGASLIAALGACGASAEQTAEIGSELRACPIIPACDAAPPAVARGAFRNIGSFLLAATSTPNHRGHDAFFRPGEPQWVVGRLSYGLLDSPLEKEDVDVYVLRGCGGAWEKLGTTQTTAGGHEAVDGVSDDRGRVYFQIPTPRALGPGRHRIRLVVKGDATATELFLEVLTTDTPVFVSDVDGTLTTSELAEVGGVLTGTIPDANPNAKEAFDALVKKGYRPLYLTARAERGTDRTRQFIAQRGFPPGIIQTSLSPFGLSGADAATFKSQALERVTSAHGFAVPIGFGNTATDAEAYAKTGIAATSAYFYKFDTTYGTKIDDYAQLGGFSALPATCGP